jgi:hypothetical protein
VGTGPVGDFNGDRHADLVVVDQNSNTVSVLLGNGDGTFQPKTDYATGATPWGIAVRDFNSDDKLDIAVAGLPEYGELGLHLERRDFCGAFPRRSIGTAMRCLKTRIRSWDETVVAIEQRSDGHPHRRSPRVLDLTVDYCRFHAAASCWHTWQFGAPTGGEFFARADWLALCLRRLLSRPGLATPSCAVSERVFGELLRRWSEGRDFSLTST